VAKDDALSACAATLQGFPFIKFHPSGLH